MTAMVNTVFVVDDDASVRKSLEWLMRSVSLPVEAFDSAEAFLRASSPDRPGCLLLDVRMRGMTGLELQKELRSRGIALPVIIITGHGDVPTAVRAFRAGACDFLEKPFDANSLVERVREALAADDETRRERTQRQAARRQLEQLTDRELEVLDRVVHGESSREIAAALRRSINTIDNQRAAIMRKLDTPSVVALVRLALSAGPENAASRVLADRRGKSA